MPHFIFTVDLTDYLDAFIVIILVIILLIIAEIKDRHDQKHYDGSDCENVIEFIKGDERAKEEYMKGYKVFNPDWTCKGFKYEVGKKYHCDGKISCCKNGFHFCTKLADCFNYYKFNSNNKVAEIEASGDIDSEEDDTKHCASDIEIIREITWYEVLDMINEGKDNTGMCNSGNRNSGDYNSGNWNSGNWNSGNGNSGNRNSGNANSGNWNSGNANSGNWNSGNWNSGNWNSGDCKHRTSYWGNCKLLEEKYHQTVRVGCDEFCSSAERRTDE